MTDSRPCVVFISDEAYEQLVEMAIDSGFMAKPSSRGMSSFVEHILNKGMFEDTRPEEVRAMDAVLLAEHQSPEWRMYGPKRQRNIRLTDKAITAAMAACVLLGMAFPPAKRILGAPTYYDGSQCVSTLLEALGTGWVSTSVPMEVLSE